ncbi:branched-chain amino acid ABC transporter permease [Desulfatitalea tepidiphila]|jgi:branched-chain amino acid transport system permease protein|uniref:branched-chain amino acid ABC transporter permease n=1 Tax=Desulfatitalea tepidiphila TaxID=1185843 RepID=UPI0006B4B256|nr:branched-chain amino acid ABC transporter permease [Desulfatitalea tepidiphila]
MLVYKLQSVLMYAFVWGSIYLLISLGFSLICGVLRIFHLGYGVTFVLAAYGTWALMHELHLGLWPAIGVMFVVQIVFALLVFYKGIFQRYLEQEEILLTLSMLVFLAVTHMANYSYPVTAGVSIPTTIIDGTFKIGKVRLSYQMLFAALTGIGVTLAFVWMFLKTRVGLIIRAMSQDIQASRLMGADVSKMYFLAMALSVIPPTICVLMIAPFWSVDPLMGAPLLTTAMLVSILGGLGNLKGSIVASYLIGFIHAFISFFYVSRFMGFAALVITLLVMIFKRGGLYPGETIW